MKLVRWMFITSAVLIIHSKAGVQFPALGKGDSYIVQNNECNGTNGFPVFSFLKYLLSFMQPNEGPNELIQLALSREIPTEMSAILKLVHLEMGYIVLGVILLITMLTLPCILLTQVCCSEYDLHDYDKSSRVCKRTLIFMLQILIVCVLVGIVGMISTNEEMSTHLRRASHMSRSALEDMSTFINNAQGDIHSVIMDSYDYIFANIEGHLENVENVLGIPIQKEIAKETGIDVALMSLMEVALEIKKLTERITALLADCATFKEKLIESGDKLRDARAQIILFKKQCPDRERMLCDTIDGEGLEITLNIDRITRDEKLLQLKQCDIDGLVLDVHRIRNEFTNLPVKIVKDTRDMRTDIKHELIVQRRMLEDAVSAVKKMSKDVTQRIFLTQRNVDNYSELFEKVDFWRWTAGIGCTLLILLLWIVLIIGVCYSCCADSYTASSILTFFMILLSLCSPILWSALYMVFTLAGHIDLVLCTPLTSGPEYRVLSKFVDESSNGNYFLSSYVYNNKSFNVPVRDVLNDCARDKPVYEVVNLNTILNVDRLTEQSKWTKLNLILNEFQVNISNLQISTPHLNNQLVHISFNLNINFSQHRDVLTGELTRKHVDSFADQLENISNQIKDLATVSRLETLTTRIKRVSVTHLQPLEKMKENLIFQMTALELSTVPLLRQLNQSISHLKTIQYFVQEHATSIAGDQTRHFLSTISDHIAEYRKHISTAIKTSVGKCHQVFIDVRETTCVLCTLGFNMLNMFWLCMFLAVVTLYVCAFVSNRLVVCLKKQVLSNFNINNGHVIHAGDGSGWNTPRISEERSNW
ncbi:hypothetical protein M8J76_003133 [Diaphorina citri]|nr:hypothetical protein M8J76_003133 [Diaphorina citri]